jgi:hypothetical protein
MVTPFFHRRDCAIEGNASGRAVTQRAHFRIPDDERWLHETQAASDLARAIEWSQQQPASEIQTDAHAICLFQNSNKMILTKKMAF